MSRSTVCRMLVLILEDLFSGCTAVGHGWSSSGYPHHEIGSMYAIPRLCHQAIICERIRRHNSSRFSVLVQVTACGLCEGKLQTAIVLVLKQPDPSDDDAGLVLTHELELYRLTSSPETAFSISLQVCSSWHPPVAETSSCLINSTAERACRFLTMKFL